MDKVKIGWIGLGNRGQMYKMMLDTMDDIEIAGVCDIYEDRLAEAQSYIEEKTGKSPIAVTDYRRLLELDEIDAIITPSSWEAHIDICIDSMLAGKYVATEVAGTYSVEQCWELVRTYERTRVPCMLLENCCYGKNELTVLNMVKHGLFGELVHCAGGYHHDLRDEVSLGEENRHYRLRNYMHRNAELYPTHELGPIAKYLDINRGNRMVMLTSMASKSAGLNAWLNSERAQGHELARENRDHVFTEGDIVTTMIKCAHGETIVLTHDTTLPRPYSRGNLVRGTRGIWSEERNGVLFDNLKNDGTFCHEWTDIEKYYGEWLHPLWREYTAVGGHGGMDYLVLRAFIEAVKSRTQTPIDVYDAAAWMAITPLSEASIACGSMPVAIPDFTNGRWTHREPPTLGKYCLDEICE